VIWRFTHNVEGRAQQWLQLPHPHTVKHIKACKSPFWPVYFCGQLLNDDSSRHIESREIAMSRQTMPYSSGYNSKLARINQVFSNTILLAKSILKNIICKNIPNQIVLISRCIL
jgi:hypothetical protein